MTLRTRTFVGIFVATSLALAVSTWLVERSTRDYLRKDIEQTLTSEAHLAAALLADSGPADPDAEADSLGRILSARVTFIALDGHVMGDSELDAAGLATVENHGAREEVVQALKTGEGHAVRLSHTTNIETQYVAVSVRNSTIAVARWVATRNDRK